MSIRCFISYRWCDKQAAFARILASRLSRFRGITAWIDITQFQVGVRLHDWLQRGIVTESDVFVPILTPEYLTGKTSQKELGLASRLADREGKPILPIVLTDCEFPLILGDLTWADFRRVLDLSGNINRDEFTKAVRSLARSVRFHAGTSSRLRQISASAVRTPSDLWTHLILRLSNEAREWRRLDDFFSLYCDISEDRGFALSPERQFERDLMDLIDEGYVEVTSTKTTLRCGQHSVSGVPEEVRISPQGTAYVLEAEHERHRAGL